MGIRTKVQLGGEWVEGEEIDFLVKKEEWNVYELKDGTEIKLKPVVTKIVRTDKFLPNRNDPVYSVSSHNVVEATVPETLKKKI